MSCQKFKEAMQAVAAQEPNQKEVEQVFEATR
jgi:hypothetical protein